MKSMSMRLTVVAVTALSVVLAGDEPRASDMQEEHSYQIVELNDLNGPDARGNSINASGMVAGYASPREPSIGRPSSGRRADDSTWGRSVGPTATSPGRARAIAAWSSASRKPRSRKRGVTDGVVEGSSA